MRASAQVAMGRFALALLLYFVRGSDGAACSGSQLSGTCIKCNQGDCTTISNKNATSTSQCCALCQGMPGCAFWTFNKGMSRCFLRMGNSSHRVQGNCDAGVLPPRPKCSGAQFTGECIKCDGKMCHVIAKANQSSVESCCISCQQHNSCKFWTFNHNSSTCFMKVGDPLVREKGACDSGILPSPIPSPSPVPHAPTGAKNVLLIVVDDLRPDIGAYGASFMHTPNMDKLAATGVLFQRAYIQYSFCAPSRNSFMTGRRPDSTKSWSFMDHFRESGVGSEWKSMPQYFKEHGYLTLGAGKIFHPGVPPSFDAPKSWDFFTSPGGCQGQVNGWPVLEDNVTNVDCPAGTAGCPSDAMMAGDGIHWCKLNTSKLEAPLQDDITVDVTLANLKRAKSDGRPFFVAAGFHKPHLPFQFPAEMDIYPPASDIKPPLHVSPPKDMPLCAWHEGNFANKWDKPCSDPSEFRRAYYSAVSYTDSNIGKVLAGLDALDLSKDTAVALIGDHGWQLGEMNLWRKMTNFELGVRVPLIFRAPWAQHAGAKTPALAEAVDLFPTLVELSGLPKVPASEGLQGTSLVKMIANPPSKGTGPKQYAFSQFAKASSWSKELGKSVLWNTCTKCNRNEIEAMGYSVRNDDWRLTEWVSWDPEKWSPLWDSQVGLELYNHSGDFGEDLDKATPTENVAADPANKQIVAVLRQVLREQFKNGSGLLDYIV